MNDKKIEFFGSMNAGLSHLEMANKQIKELWNGGEMRMKLDDLEQITAIERKIKSELSGIKGIKEMFIGISNHKIVEEKAEKLN